MAHTLTNGIELPAIGYGTAELTGDIRQLVMAAVRCGYRMIDTAAVYGSEEAIGEAVSELTANGELCREELFLETKLDPKLHGYHAALRGFQESLDKLQTDYLDMYMIHWPVARGSEDTYREENLETWRAFEELYQKGKVRAIGVCNFLERHLLQLMEACSVPPMVDQLEIHPGYQQRGLVRFCIEQGLVIEAWSPLGRGILNGPEFQAMAAKHGKSAAQLALRWSVQRGHVPLTRSSSPAHMAGNLDIFDFTLSDEEMAAMDQLNTNDGHMDIWSYKRQQMY